MLGVSLPDLLRDPCADRRQKDKPYPPRPAECDTSPAHWWDMYSPETGSVWTTFRATGYRPPVSRRPLLWWQHSTALHSELARHCGQLSNQSRYSNLPALPKSLGSQMIALSLPDLSG